MARRYALILSAVGLALWIGFREETLGALLLLWRIEVARAALTLIHWTGMAAARDAAVIFHPGGFAYEISRGCTGLVPAALFATAVAAYPRAAGWKKLAGVALGVPLWLVLNLVRLAHLYYLGVYRPQWFGVAHEIVWSGMTILAILGLWAAWARWADPVRSGRDGIGGHPRPSVS